MIKHYKTLGHDTATFTKYDPYIEIMRTIIEGAKAQLMAPCQVCHEYFEGQKERLIVETDIDYRSAYDMFHDRNAAGELCFPAMLGHDGPVEYLQRWRKHYLRRIMSCFDEHGMAETIKRFNLKLIKNKSSQFFNNAHYTVNFYGMKEDFMRVHGENWRGWGRKVNSKRSDYGGYDTIYE